MYLYGAGGHAKVIAQILSDCGRPVEGVVDDDPRVNQWQGCRVLPRPEGLSPFIVSIGNNGIRKRIAERLSCRFATAVHPSAVVSPSALIGEGSVVMQGALIQADSRVGKHCIINTGACVDHDCLVEDYAHISPHATLCGNVHIGQGTWIGAGATVIPGVKIGRWCVIAAGAVVTKDIPDGILAAGNRCRNIKKIDISKT